MSNRINELTEDIFKKSERIYNRFHTDSVFCIMRPNGAAPYEGLKGGADYFLDMGMMRKWVLPLQRHDEPLIADYLELIATLIMKLEAHLEMERDSGMLDKRHSCLPAYISHLQQLIPLIIELKEELKKS